MYKLRKRIAVSWVSLVTSATCFAQQQQIISSAIDTNLANTSEQIKLTNIKSTHFIAPAILIAYGFATVYDNAVLKELDLSTRVELQEHHPKFAYHVDDYAQFAPALAVYGLNLAGVKGKHKLSDATMLYVTSAAIMGLSTHLIKKGVHRLRPDYSAYNSFPSGHTASAFAAAEFLHQEFRDQSPWIGYAGYFVATATGTLRMYNNKHWFSDVVAGAGIGIVATKLGYLIYPQLKKLISSEKKQFIVAPILLQGQLGYSITYRL